VWRLSITENWTIIYLLQKFSRSSCITCNGLQMRCTYPDLVGHYIYIHTHTYKILFNLRCLDSLYSWLRIRCFQSIIHLSPRQTSTAGQGIHAWEVPVYSIRELTSTQMIKLEEINPTMWSSNAFLNFLKRTWSTGDI